MKIHRILTAATLAASTLLLCACGNSVAREAPPVYVYKTQAEAATSEDLIFDSWQSETDKTAENTGKEVTPQTSGTSAQTTGKYRDVSKCDNAIAVPSFYAKAGDTVTVPLRICGKENLCALDLKIVYDPSMLKFLEFEDTDADVVSNCDEQTGTLYLNFLRTANIDDGLELCKLSFEVVGQEPVESPLDIEIKQVVGLDKKNEIVMCGYTAVDGMAHLNSAG